MKYYPNIRKVLPAVYDEALSYYEQVIYLIDCINKLGEEIDGMENGILVQANTYTDSKIKILNSYVDSIKNSTEEVIKELDNNFRKEIRELKLENSELSDKVNKELDSIEKDLKSEILKLNDKIVNLYISFNFLEKNNFENLKEIEKDLRNFIKDSLAFKSGEYVLVYNPIKKTTTSLNVFIDDFYKCFYKLGGVTLEQYDDSNIKFEVYDSLKITLENYDLKGYFILFKHIEMLPFHDIIISEMIEQNNMLRDDINRVEKLLYMLSPFTGEESDIKQIINKLVELHKVALTSSEFDNKNLTAENFDLLNITAYDFDWNSKNII